MAAKPERIFPGRMVFHVDMDAFFAAIEQLENPAYRNKSLIVGGLDSARGVVTSASYEARVFGIHSAQPMAQARRRCPHGIYVNGRHGVYHAYSRRLMDCLTEFSPLIEQISIDEAFMDMTGSDGLFGDAFASGALVKARIRESLGLTASVGVAECKFLAKLASDVNKPDGLTVVKPGEALAFLDPLPVDRLWGAGKKTTEALRRLGLYTIAQLRRFPFEELAAHFGKRFARHLQELSLGRDERELASEHMEKSISHERTFETDTADWEELLSTLLELCDRVARRARKEELSGKTISLVWRDTDFSRHSHSISLPIGTQESREIYGAAANLFREIALKNGAARKFRLLGIKISNFSGESGQLSLFQAAQTRPNLDSAMDAVRDRFGENAIRRARTTPRL